MRKTLRDERLARADVTIARLGAELADAERRAEAARGDVRQLKRALRVAEQALEDAIDLKPNGSPRR